MRRSHDVLGGWVMMLGPVVIPWWGAVCLLLLIMVVSCIVGLVADYWIWGDDDDL